MPPAETTELGFVTWDRDTPTGGNVYNQHLVAELGGCGIDLRLHALPGPWPEGDASSHAKLARALREAPISLVDGIVACGAPDVIAAAVASGLMIIIVLHLPISAEFGLEPRRRERYLALETRAIRAASGIICPSFWSAAEARRRYGRDDIGVAIPGVTPAATARGSLDAGSPHLLTLASLTPTKDQLTVVRALAELVELPWTAAMVGSDQAHRDYAAAVRAEVASAGLGERIIVPGLLSGPELDQEWDAADLLVLPSRVESFALVIGEALARGIPAVVTSGTGSIEALQQGATTSSDPTPGAAVPVGDPASLAGALREWLTQPTLRREWRQSALSRRDTLPEWRQTADAVLAYLERHQSLRSTPTGSLPASPPTPPLAPPRSSPWSPS
jgi:glycosyltransferase involved in cell wall biosynthesis